MTRPRAEAESLAEALAARGIEALIEPLIEIHDRSEPVPDLVGVQAILCTSANGVRALAKLTGERGLPLFAVGDASATRARDEGFARVESAGGSSADLALLARERLRPDAARLVEYGAIDGKTVRAQRTGQIARHIAARDMEEAPRIRTQPLAREEGE
ncbi:MAG: uroporphyrinogen-III synthase, partial [Alphaproteobacteria bacterium]